MCFIVSPLPRPERQQRQIVTSGGAKYWVKLKQECTPLFRGRWEASVIGLPGCSTVGQGVDGTLRDLKALVEKHLEMSE